MGSVGAVTNSVTSVIPDNVSKLGRYTHDWREGLANIREDFNLNFASENQLQTIRDIFKGMEQYDVGYDEGKTPYIIESINIQRLGGEPDPEELARNKELFGRTFENKDISVRITTRPDSDNAYIRMMDEKERYVLIGRNGGLYRFNRKGNKVSVRSFDVHYGTRR